MARSEWPNVGREKVVSDCEPVRGSAPATFCAGGDVEPSQSSYQLWESLLEAYLVLVQVSQSRDSKKLQMSADDSEEALVAEDRVVSFLPGREGSAAMEGCLVDQMK